MDSKHINITLALAKQTYEELIHLAPLAELQKNEFGVGTKRERIEELLRKINANINSIQRLLTDSVSDSSAAPILSVPPAHRSFYYDVIVPHGKSLQRAYFEIVGMGMFIDLLDDPSPNHKPSHTMLNTMNFALERWSVMLDEDESHELYERGLNIEGTQELIDMPWFLPDEWSHNIKLLHPVLVDRAPQVMRDHVHYRLTEIYRAFAFGLWMAAIALSRSLVEFAIKSNASRLGITVNYEGASGRTEDKSLKWLGEDVSNKRPSLARSLEVVRETGNRILHPKKHDVIAHPKVRQKEALECIRAAQFIVESLYSEVPFSEK